MANTKKSTIAENTVIEDVKPVSKVDTEKEELKSKIAEQATQMAELQAKMEAMLTMMGQQSNKTESTTQSKRNITFVNLTKGILVLRGSRIYEIEGQFKTRKFLESEARIIVSNMPNAVADGLVYIPDAQFVKDCDLEDVYQNVLTDKQLKELLTQDVSYVLEVYKNASDGQKRIIEDMVSDNCLNGMSVDANILVQLGKLCGKDFMSIEKEEE